MANPVVNLTYIGQPGSAAQGGMIVADQTSGPKAKTLYAYGSLVASSGTFSTTTTARVNFIDGVNTFGKNVTLQVQSVTAPATINGTANSVQYFSTGADSTVPVGTSVTVAGFANSGNNGTFTVTAVGASFVQVVNSSAVAETNPAGSMTMTIGGVPAWVDIFLAGSAGDSSAAFALMASSYLVASSIVGTGFAITTPNFVTTGATVTLGAIIAFSS